MAGVAHADAPKSVVLGWGLPMGRPWRWHPWCGRSYGTVRTDLQTVLANQATGQEGAGARLLQVG